MITVNEFMVTDLYTLSPDDTLLMAQNMMVTHNIRHLPVVNDNQQLVGLFTHRDLLAAAESSLDNLGESGSRSRQQPINKDCYLSQKVSVVMTDKLKVVEPGTSLRAAAMHLRKHRHGCLPVVENDQLVGIITDSDFVTIAINLIEQVEEAESFDDGDF